MARQSGDFHTRYRPQSFDEVRGQDPVVKSLKGLVARKGAHSFVFTGPSGTGKTTLARIVLRELGCDPANLLEIDAATHTGVEHWRVITEGLRYAPLGGATRMKGVIVDEAHALSKSAWQSLLKDVEEPPEHVFWCFCTTEGSKVPQTILTRCARFDLSPLRPDDLYDLLVEVCEREGKGPAEEVLGLIARRSGGSPREALTALAACWDAKTAKEAAALMKTAGQDPDVISIARGLVSGELTWPKAAAILKTLDGQHAESLRLTTQAYLTKVALGAKTPQQAAKACALLEPFASPYPPGTSVAPFLLSVAEILLGE